MMKNLTQNLQSLRYHDDTQTSRTHSPHETQSHHQLKNQKATTNALEKIAEEEDSDKVYESPEFRRYIKKFIQSGSANKLNPACVSAKVMAIECIHFAFNYLRKKQENCTGIIEFRSNLLHKYPYLLLFIVNLQKSSSSETTAIATFFEAYEDVFVIRKNQMTIKKFQKLFKKWINSKA